jgi:Ti type entry exclusion protein TrbK
VVKAKVILIVIAVILVTGSAGAWIFISKKQEAQEHRQEFFGTTKEFPTLGGKKMKSEW